MSIDLDGIVQAYIACRDQRDRIKQEAKDKCAQIEQMMSDAEGYMMQHLKDTGTESVKTAHGTFYRNKFTRAKVEDAAAFFGYVRDNDRFDLLEKRVAKTAVVDDLENGIETPGVTMTSGFEVRIRRT